MILGLGTDVIGVERVRTIFERHEEHFLERYFTENEKSYCLQARDPSERLAALGSKRSSHESTRTGWAQGVQFQHISVERAESGAPHIIFSGAAKERCAELGVARSWLSMSHADGVAMATVILER